jgi:hypothetical protein
LILQPTDVFIPDPDDYDAYSTATEDFDENLGY